MKLVSEAVADRLCRRLLEHAQALEALRAEFGIDPETAKRFRVGLADPYPKKTPTSPEPFHQDALVGPVRDERGRFIKRYVYAVLPGITVDRRLQHDRRLRWSVGSALTYYSRAASDTAAVFVCGDVVDLWAVAGLISGTSLEGQLVLIGLQMFPWDVPSLSAMAVRAVGRCGSRRHSFLATSSGQAKVFCSLLSVTPGRQFVTYAGALRQAPIPGFFDSRDVDENVLAAVIRPDETIAFAGQ